MSQSKEYTVNKSVFLSHLNSCLQAARLFNGILVAGWVFTL